MVRHIILWKIKDEIKGEDKFKVIKEIKENLEGLMGKIPGLNKIKVHINALASSNADMMLDTELTDINALDEYQIHPEHVYVASTYVRPATQVRMCIDFEV